MPMGQVMLPTVHFHDLKSTSQPQVGQEKPRRPKLAAKKKIAD
jgi:hypothetical protein